jgi:predicted nucleotidyltransferase
MKITPQIKQAIGKLAKKHKLTLVIVFGSQVSGKVHERSDMDIAVRTENDDVTIGFYSELLEDFSRIFDKNKIDLVFIHRADPLLLHHICQNALLLYGKEKDFHKLKMYSFKRYIDYRPFFLLESRFVDKFISGLAHGSR